MKHKRNNKKSNVLWLDEHNVTKDFPFVDISGINSIYSRRLGLKPTLYNVFSQFLGDVYDFHRNERLSSYDPKRYKLKDEWHPVDVQELKTYFPLYILMGQIKKPSFQMYWSTRKILETKIVGH